MKSAKRQVERGDREGQRATMRFYLELGGKKGDVVDELDKFFEGRQCVFG